MKACVGIFVISFFVNQEMILARLYGSPNFLDGNHHNDGQLTRLAYREKLLHYMGVCVDELGLRGMNFLMFS